MRVLRNRYGLLELAESPELDGKPGRDLQDGIRQGFREFPFQGTNEIGIISSQRHGVRCSRESAVKPMHWLGVECIGPKQFSR